MRRQTWDQNGNLIEDVELPDPPEIVLAKKRQEARARAVQGILANKGQAPWGQALYDLAVAQGLIEPE